MRKLSSVEGVICVSVHLGYMFIALLLPMNGGTCAVETRSREKVVVI